MSASLLYNSTHSCSCTLTFASFVAGNGRHVINKWVGLPKLGGFLEPPLGTGLHQHDVDPGPLKLQI